MIIVVVESIRSSNIVFSFLCFLNIFLKWEEVVVLVEGLDL